MSKSKSISVSMNTNQHAKHSKVKRTAVAVLVALMLALLQGCINIGMHIDGDETIYGGTRCACIVWSEVFCVRPELHYNSIVEAEIAHAYALLYSPILLVDTPFELVTDTLTLPYDIFATCRDARDAEIQED